MGSSFGSNVKRPKKGVQPPAPLLRTWVACFGDNSCIGLIDKIMCDLYEIYVNDSRSSERLAPVVSVERT